MNRIYKVVWNAARGCYVVGSELISCHSREKSGRLAKIKISALILGAVCGFSLSSLPSICAAENVQHEEIAAETAKYDEKTAEAILLRLTGRANRNVEQKSTADTAELKENTDEEALKAANSEPQPEETTTLADGTLAQHSTHDENGYYVHNGDTYNSLTKDGLWVGGTDDSSGFHVDKDGNVTTTGTAQFKQGASTGGNKITDVADGKIEADSTDAVNGGQLAAYVAGELNYTGEGAVSVKDRTISVNTGEGLTVDEDELTLALKENGNLAFDTDGNLILKDSITVADANIAGTVSAGNVAVTNELTAGAINIDSVTIDNNTITGLSNTAWTGDNIVNDRAATEGQLKQALENLDLNDISMTVDGEERSLQSAGIIPGSTEKSDQTYAKEAIAIGHSATATGDYSTALGYDTIASENYSTALGNSAQATGESSTALGRQANASGVSSTALGYLAQATGESSAALGHRATASGVSSMALGHQAKATGDYSTALGYLANASAQYSIAVGNNASAIEYSGIAVGTGASASGDTSVALGNTARAFASYSIALGYETTVSEDGDEGTALGYKTTASGQYSTALGTHATASGQSGIALGNTAQATQSHSIALGAYTTASGDSSIAVGYNANATASNSVALGSGSVADKENVISVGTDIQQRQIINVADSTDKHDAVTLGQMNALIFGSRTTGSTMSLDNGATSLIEGINKNTSAIEQLDKSKEITWNNLQTATQNVDNLTQKVSAFAAQTENVDWNALNSVDWGAVSAYSHTAVMPMVLSTENLPAANNTMPLADDETASARSAPDGLEDVTHDTNGYTFDTDVTIKKDLTVDGTATFKQEAVFEKGASMQGELKVNDNKITGLKDGDIAEGSKDAVNGGQIFTIKNELQEGIDNNASAINQLGRSIYDLDNRVDQVGANAAALAGLHPLDYDPDNKLEFAVGYGNYRSADAVAVGAFYHPDENVMVSLGGATGGGEDMINLGVSFKIGSGADSVTTSRTAMARELSAMKEIVTQQDEQLAMQKQQLAEQEEKIKQLEAMIKKIADEKIDEQSA